MKLEGREHLLSFLAQHGSKCTLNSQRVGLEAKAIMSATTLYAFPNSSAAVNEKSEEGKYMALG